MTPVNRVLDDQDEPALLRDQFRQLLRYRALLAVGVVIGLLGGAYLALSGEDTYTATGEVLVRSAISDPFASGATADKGINIGSERQTAVSDTVGTLAAATLLKKGDDVAARELLAGLQVTNPPNTLTLRFAYTGATPEQSRARAEALANAYLAHRKARTEDSIKNMSDGYRAQLDPLEEKRDLLEKGTTGAADDVSSARANIIVSISELSRKISELKALDTTPGYLNKKPVAPTSPTGPGLPLLLGLGGVVGLALGLLLSWVRLVFDPAVRSTRELVRSLGAPLLGTLPRERGAAGTVLAIGRSGSRLAEEYRAVAFRLAYDPSFAESRRLLVTAPRGDNEEAAAAAANLAAAFAEMGRDVLLVEADLRTPSLARALGSAAHEVRPPRWAAEEGDGSWPTGGRSNVDVPGSGAFALIPGTTVDNVPRALTSTPVGRIVAEADRPGNVVIVLAPPVLSYADAVALVDRVEGVMIVCDPRDVHRSDLERIREIIGASGGSVLGALLHPARRRLTRSERHPKSTRRRGGGPTPTTEPDEPEITGDPTETLGLRSLTLPAARR
ncbi:lipopolysaccharide biosynthesis protein [Streptomyces sp. SID8374]|uniref:tyrosine-protein kinase domain-containing protein n=1 Tax=Streptomyces sp. SID8374 TaxID=2690354 RepID=UPI001370A755|nr:CpsD/CapB family tyrosine-protein kinase [Streptomyces sp. SID8374]MYX17243.1 lipopolysaccharide biosynthesis protein [Streptomyces sp. SID8374]